MEFFIVVGIIGFFVGNCIMFINFSSHKYMVGSEKGELKKGTFNDFLHEYRSYYLWERDSKYSTAHFGSGADHSKFYIHANIIRFRGINMRLDYVSYIRFSIWRHKNRIRKDFKNLEKWT